MHYSFVDDVYQHAVDKALELLRAGNDTLLVAETRDQCMDIGLKLRGRARIRYPMLYTIEIGNSCLFIRAANRHSGLRSVC